MNVPQSVHPARLQIVSFFAGGVPCAVQSCFVARMGRIGAREGGLSAGRFFGIVGTRSNEEHSGGRYLELSVAGITVSIGVQEPVALCTLDWAAIHPLPALVAARCAIRGLRALAFDGESLLLVLDPRLVVAGALFDPPR